MKFEEAGACGGHVPFFPDRIRELQNRSGQTAVTILTAPENYGKAAFAEGCARQFGLKILRFSILDDDSEETCWDRFLHFLFEQKKVPEELEKDCFASGGAHYQMLEMQMRSCAAEARKQNYYGCGVILEHMERQELPRFIRFLRNFEKRPAAGWHVWLLYECGGTETRAGAFRQTAFPPELNEKHTLRIGINELCLHAEDIYEMFLHDHIPVTIEAVVSLYHHSGGAVGEISEVLKLQQNRASSLTQLPKRELEIASMASSGLTNREIAERLYISENTVKSAMKNIFQRLHITSRRKLIALINPETRMR
jgi:DNA-binding CsgD family transcriptional regulator